MNINRFENMFPEELEACIEKCPIAVLPLGTLEWHSHHLPLGFDGIVAQALCERIASQMDAVLVPVSYSAVGGVPYPYTLQLPISVIEPLYATIFEQFAGMGFRVIVTFTGHFGLDQTLTLKRAAVEVMRRTAAVILPVTEYDLVTDVGYLGDHAAIGETSLMMDLFPDKVRLDAVSPETPLDGVLGRDPREGADGERGKEWNDAIVSRTAEVALRLLNQTSPLQRIDFIEAIAAGVKVLAKLHQMRQTMVKKKVPSVGTPAYLTYCQEIYRGNYREAKTIVERKLEDLSQ